MTPGDSKRAQIANCVSPANIGTMKKPQKRVLADGAVRWRIFFRAPDAEGKMRQTSQGFEDYASAERWAKLVDDVGIAEALSVLPSWRGEVKTATTVQEWVLEHVDLMTGVGADYKKRSRAVARNDLGALGKLPIDSVTEEAIGRWVARMEADGASGKTIKNKHGLVASAMKRAVRKGLLAANPCEETRIPKSIRKEMVILTPNEFVDFLACFTPHWRPLVAFLYGSGCRFSEATALTPADIDVEGLGASVTKAWKDGGKTLGPPKTEKSRRRVALAPEIVDMLKPLLKRPADALLFVNQRGDRVSNQTFHDNAWDPAVRLANGEAAQRDGAKRVARRVDENGQIIKPLKKPIGKRPRVHDMRHSHASWLLSRGVPITYVQAQLGHESIQTTVDRYGHLMPGAGAAISAALSGAISGALPQIEP